MHGSEAHSLGQNRWKICIPLPPLTPNQGSEIGAFCVCAASSLICGGEDGGLLFHFILSKIAGAVSRGGRMVMM